MGLGGQVMGGREALHTGVDLKSCIEDNAMATGSKKGYINTEISCVCGAPGCLVTFAGQAKLIKMRRDKLKAKGLARFPRNVPDLSAANSAHCSDGSGLPVHGANC